MLIMFYVILLLPVEFYFFNWFFKNIIFLSIEIRRWVLHLKYTLGVCPLSLSPQKLNLCKKKDLFNFFVKQILYLEIQLRFVQLNLFLFFSSNVLDCLDVVENIIWTAAVYNVCSRLTNCVHIQLFFFNFPYER